MLVEIGVVNTHSPFIILFLYEDGVSYPLWMDYFFNESSREEFSDFPFNEMGTSDQRSGRGATVSMDIISQRSNFCSRLEPKSPSPPKMTLTVFEAS
jgi:hypothetical protein